MLRISHVAALGALLGSSVVAVAGDAAVKPMPFRQVVDLPLLWPAETTVNTDLSDGTNEIKAGQAMRVHSLEPQGVVVVMPDNSLMMLRPDWTDVGARAASVAEGLPADLRTLTLADLAKRDDLFPDRVATTTPIEFDNAPAMPVGAEFVPGRLVATRGGATMFGVRADMPESGPVQRTYFDISYTDFVARVRDKATHHPETVGKRFITALSGNLVDAEGNPVEVKDSTEYFLVLHGAGWCGWCRKLMPDVMKFYQENAASRDRFEIVLVSADKSEEEMYAYMREAQMPWPALKYGNHAETAPVVAMTDGATPHMLLVARDGRILHQGEPIGGKGASAAMQTLKRKLAE